MIYDELTSRQKQLVLDAIELEKENIIDADALGFIHRSMATTSLPYKDLKDQTYLEKENGFYKLVVQGTKGVGIPYGNLVRLIHIYLCSQVVKTGEATVYLGNNFSQFMKNLDLSITGGRNGSITRVKNQLKRMFYSQIYLIESHQDIQPDGHTIKNYERTVKLNIADELNLIWSKDPNQKSLFESHITLNQTYANEILAHKIPIDMRIVKSLKSSPLEIDLYLWLNYKNHFLKRPMRVPYKLLQLQLGSNYKQSSNFRIRLNQALYNLTLIWQELNIESYDKGIILKPSKRTVQIRGYKAGE